MFRVSLLLLAAAALSFGQSKVGIINVQSAILETAEIKKAQTDLEGRYKPRQQQMEKLQKDLADIQNQLQTGQGKLTPQAEQELQLNGQRKQRDLQRLSEDLQADVERDRNEILSRAGSRMHGVVGKLAEEKGLDIVIDVSNAIYFKPALDLTKEAVAAYDKTHPLAATAASAK
ncbi:MAG: OmpH family outer membrane protein [Acidobacteria bacterium]|nr:OmpH family outer membrane protein [Acidobacteriota bacterium]